jgi:hypothetical protein
MQTILKGLRDLDGVNGTFVSDAGGALLAYNAEPIYDASLLEQVSRSIASAIDSVKLLHEDWETITAQFSDGRLVIRSIPAARNRVLNSPCRSLLMLGSIRRLPLSQFVSRLAKSKPYLMHMEEYCLLLPWLEVILPLYPMLPVAYPGSFPRH